jgi:hypothetical protein
VHTSDLATSSLPPLYALWIEEALGGAMPRDCQATCSACAMCKPNAAKAATAGLTLFDAVTKCCTYVPTLVNFLVGLILNDDDPSAIAGRTSRRPTEQLCAEVTKAVGRPPDHALVSRLAGFGVLWRCLRPERTGRC